MRSKCKRSFWELYENLPQEVQREAKHAYRIFKADPGSPGLNFEAVTPKRKVEAVTPKRKVWSVRISGDYRAFGARRPETPDLIIWFWIGTHNDYDKLIRQLRRRENQV